MLIHPRKLRHKEIDLRKEFIELTEGSETKTRLSRYGLVRIAKLDGSGIPIKCTCVGVQDKRPDNSCNKCRGEGYLWIEYWIKYYKTVITSQGSLAVKKEQQPMSVMNVPTIYFYMKYNTVTPDRKLVEDTDRIIEVATNDEGKIIKPLIRTKFWNINTVEELFEQNGRVEFWRIACRKDSLWTDANM